MFYIDMEQVLWRDSDNSFFEFKSLCELVKNMNLPVLSSCLILQTFVSLGSLQEGRIVSFKLV